VEVGPDFAAFEIPDLFVVGYGLDFDSQYRNLPYVAALTPDEPAEPADEELDPIDEPAESETPGRSSREAKA
jgi:hypothetical protein